MAGAVRSGLDLLASWRACAGAASRPLPGRGCGVAVAGARAAVIAAVRAAHPGLSHAVLIRLDDGTFTDAWRWDTAGQMQAALAAMPIPEARTAMSLTRDNTAQDGEILDER